MTRSTRAWLAAVAVIVGTLAPSAAFAQLDETSWGISAGVTPYWSMPGDMLGSLFGDDVTLDIKGPEFRLGVIRGTTNGGEWGVSLIYKRLAKDSHVEVAGSTSLLSVNADDAEMLGVEVNRFFPFARAGRVQIGANLGGGVGTLRGFVHGSLIPTGGSSSTATDVTLPFSESFSLATDQEVHVIPLGRAEIGAAALIGDRLKVRVSGGFNVPGFQVVSLSFSYLLGQDR